MEKFESHACNKFIKGSNEQASFWLLCPTQYTVINCYTGPVQQKLCNSACTNPPKNFMMFSEFQSQGEVLQAERVVKHFADLDEDCYQT